MRFNLATPVFVYPLGLLGFILVTYALAFVILATYHPGGVKHATQIKGKQDDVGLTQQGSDQTSMLDKKPSRRPVDVVVRNLQLSVSRRSLLGRGQSTPKVILADVSAQFPAGQISVIMGPSGVSTGTFFRSSSTLADRQSTSIGR